MFVIASGVASLTGSTKADYDAAVKVLDANLPVLLQAVEGNPEVGLMTSASDLAHASSTYAGEPNKLGPQGAACLTAIEAAIQQAGTEDSPPYPGAAAVLAAFGF
jgi:hypothetical protein